VVFDWAENFSKQKKHMQHISVNEHTISPPKPQLLGVSMCFLKTSQAINQALKAGS
jgi:hypothetical protein